MQHDYGPKKGLDDVIALRLSTEQWDEVVKRLPKPLHRSMCYLDLDARWHLGGWDHIDRIAKQYPEVFAGRWGVSVRTARAFVFSWGSDRCSTGTRGGR
jgi:hypothetical protein